jgi:hypothetical protein
MFDRLPRAALIALPPETLADALLEAWQEVDEQQALLDYMDQDHGVTGLAFSIVHGERGEWRMLVSGPVALANQAGPRAITLAGKYFKLLGAVSTEIISQRAARPAEGKTDGT